MGNFINVPSYNNGKKNKTIIVYFYFSNGIHTLEVLVRFHPSKKYRGHVPLCL